jgi:hypothetical protein
MRVYLNNIPFQAALLAKNGWLQQALELSQLGLSRNLIDYSMFEALMRVIDQSKALRVSRQHEIFGIVHDSVLSSLQLSELISVEEMKEAFRQAVRLVEIETSSQCNRQCSYCPNSVFDRRSSNQFLDMEIYRGVISDLAEIGYDGQLKLVGNNEFFMHPENFDYLKAAQDKLPGAEKHLLSNGDYLTREMLEQAERLGVTVLDVTFHQGKGKTFDNADVLERAYKFSSKNNLPIQVLNFERDCTLRFVSKLGNMTIYCGAYNYDAVGHNWGDQLTQLSKGPVRTAPCTYPLRQFILNYEGGMFMCCIAFKQKTAENVASGAYTGDIADYPSIFHAYASRPMLDWRRGVFHNAAKTGPCAQCIGHFGQSDEMFRDLADHVAGRLEQKSAA